eukprot:s826_g17.t1
MHGLIHVIYKKFVLQTFGEEAWTMCQEKANSAEAKLLCQEAQADGTTTTLFRAICESQFIEMDDLLERFGQFFVQHVAEEGYITFLQSLGRNLFEHLSNVNLLHDHVLRDHNTCVFPLLEVNSVSGDPTSDLHVFRVSYGSTRNFLNKFLIGILRGAAFVLYNCTVEIEDSDPPEMGPTMPFQHAFQVTVHRNAHRASLLPFRSSYAATAPKGGNFFDFHSLMVSMWTCVSCAEVSTSCCETSSGSNAALRLSQYRDLSPDVRTIVLEKQESIEKILEPYIPIDPEAQVSPYDDLVKTLTGTDRLRLAAILFRGVGATLVAAPWTELDNRPEVSDFWDIQGHGDACYRSSKAQKYQLRKIWFVIFPWLASSMTVLPTEAEARALTTVQEAVTLLRIAPAVWTGFVEQIGDPGTDLRVLAALPAHVLVQAIASAQVAGRGFSPIEATHVGLVWRAARMATFLRRGGTVENFVDVDPWEPASSSVPAQPQGQVVKSSGLKEKVLKMSSTIDQTDDSELMPPDQQTIQTWSQRYFQTMGDFPMEEEEPTDAQMAALDKRVNQLGQAPYVDMGIWMPFGRRFMRNQKLRTFFPIGDGTFVAREFPGPQNFQMWQASWRVFRVAAISLDVCSLAALIAYEKVIERLTVQWPRNWSLICYADDKARAERLERVRRQIVLDKGNGKTIPADFTEEKPWSTCFRLVAQDEICWNEQVRHPATSWLASGSKGTPMATAESMTMAHFPGLPDGQDLESNGGERDERRRQANRDKRAAKKRRAQADREELTKWRSSNSTGKGSNVGGKGKGKMKGKDQAGEEICFSWAKNSGPCAGLTPGSECKSKVKRSHKCQYCLSPGHTNEQCPNK